MWVSSGTRSHDDPGTLSSGCLGVDGRRRNKSSGAASTPKRKEEEIRFFCVLFGLCKGLYIESKNSY